LLTEDEKLLKGQLQAEALKQARELEFSRQVRVRWLLMTHFAAIG
jgi:hypothetical protein